MASCYQCNKEIPFKEIYFSGTSNNVKYFWSTGKKILVTCKSCSTLNHISNGSRGWEILITFSYVIFALCLIGFFPKLFGNFFGIFFLILFVNIPYYFWWKYLVKFIELKHFRDTFL